MDKIDDRPVQRHDSGVLVMTGKQLQDWALRRGRDQLDEQQVEAIWSQITQHARKRDVVERDKRPMPRSIQELLFGALGCLVAALVGFVVAGQLLEVTGSLLAWMACGLVMLAIAELVQRRTDRRRWSARSFQLGTVLLYVLGAAAALRAYLQA